MDATQIAGESQGESGQYVRIGLIVLGAAGLLFGAKVARDRYLEKVKEETENSAADVAAAQVLKRVSDLENKLEQVLELLTDDPESSEGGAAA